MCGGSPSPPPVKQAPEKTDADIARESEEERMRLKYSQYGLSSLYKPGAGDFSSEDKPKTQKVVLGGGTS